MKKTNLTSLGLSELENKVYMSLLTLGQGSAVLIARDCHVPKTTCYEILNNFVTKGLATVYMKKSRRYFSAANPAIFETRVKAQQASLEQLMPELIALYTKSGKVPKVRMYEGQAGASLVLREILDEAKEVLGISSSEDIFTKLDDFRGFIAERAKKRIPAKIFLPSGSSSEELASRDSSDLRQTKILKTTSTFHSFIQVWNDKVAMFDLKDNVVVFVIDSKQIAETFKILLEVFWKELS